MRFLKITFVALAAAFAFISCGRNDAKIQEGIVISESKSYEASIYRQNCAICHGREGYGKEVDGKLVPSLRFGDAAVRTEEQIYAQIAFGKLPMPAFRSQLSESEMRRMARFIKRDVQGRN